MFARGGRSMFNLSKEETGGPSVETHTTISKDAFVNANDAGKANK